ncbi:MAG TPA: nitrite reductase small subunit NirD [Stellaceae bacterium]|jgi:nitrite reductase (NADH) small subunit|nr:nitrite reductase small subunit NirD [Stellaceae bacterium]
MDASVASEIWRDIGAIDDIPRLGARVVATQEGNIAVFRTSGDAVYAIDDRCPHKNGPLSQGIVHGTAVTCPLHNWTIDLATGEAAEPDRGCVRRIRVRIENTRILLMLPTTHRD